MNTTVRRCLGVGMGFVLALGGSSIAGAAGRPTHASVTTSGRGTSPGTHAKASPTLPGRFVFNTSDSQFNAGVDNQGWWSVDTENTNRNDNYIVGRAVQSTYRDFFTFDLSSLNTRVYSATLQLRRYRDWGRPTETLALHDVATPAQRLNNNHGTSRRIFRDLGTGARYGTFRLSTVGTNPSQIRTLRLDRKAIADINANRGDFFSIGGALTTASNGGALFAFSTGVGIQRLVVRGCSIKGTDAPDVLVGTPRADIICAQGGNDRIDAGGGNDLVLGGSGNDVIAPGRGRDIVRAGRGGDVVVGFRGGDSINGRQGNDFLRGGIGADRLVGGLGIDTLHGKRGTDRLLGKAGNDSLRGGRGSDQLDGGVGRDACQGGRGVDTLRRCEGPGLKARERSLARALRWIDRVRGD